jgi:CBS domain-containing protein
MKISDVMTPNPKCVGPSDSLQAAASIMRDEDTGVVPVVEDGRIRGLVTDRDIVIRCIADGDFQAKISDVMSDDVITCEPDMSTSDAAALLSEHQIRRIPVVGADDLLVGIVSIGDLAVKEGRDSRMGDTLEKVSEGVKRH